MRVLQGRWVLSLVLLFLVVSTYSPAYAVDDITDIICVYNCSDDAGTNQVDTYSRPTTTPGDSGSSRADRERRRLGNRAWNNAYDAYLRGDMDEALEEFREAYRHLRTSEMEHGFNAIATRIEYYGRVSSNANNWGDEAARDGYYNDAIQFFEEAIAFAQTREAEDAARRALRTAEQRQSEANRLLTRRARDVRRFSDGRCEALTWCRTARLVRDVSRGIYGTAWTDDASTLHRRKWWDTPGTDEPGATAIPVNPHSTPGSPTPVRARDYSRFPVIPSGHHDVERLTQLRDYAREQRQLASDAFGTITAATAPAAARAADIGRAHDAAADAATEQAHCIIDASFVPGGTPPVAQCSGE